MSISLFVYFDTDYFRFLFIKQTYREYKEEIMVDLDWAFLIGITSLSAA